jgi:alginate O-acetyltransferase complex protein AlgI
MLFNSYGFIFLFLPFTVIGYYALARQEATRASRVWLVACSVLYYGWWEPTYVPLLAGSAVGNYGIGRLVHSRSAPSARRWLVACGVGLNLLVLGVFKYSNFAVDNVNAMVGGDLALRDIVLPIGISFFTFQQIAYLVDILRGGVERYPFVDYCLFVSFFPQLIAGPIVHHDDVMPQFRRLSGGDRAAHLSVGLATFVIGLFKKVVVADYLARVATQVFDGGAVGGSVTFADAWTATTAYSLQIYFDFSGYSDMAVGIACMFGIRLPLNFDSPYKARNMVDFWKRWHMTLSGFLRDYLYIPLGGNRRGATRRYINLMLTMLLGGMWHGAGWNFLAWGGLHGIYLAATHCWLAWRRGRMGQPRVPGSLWRAAGVVPTFLAVALAWVFFRAPGFGVAWEMTKGLLGVHGVSLVTTTVSRRSFVVLPCLLAAVWTMPNTQQIMRHHLPLLERDRQPDDAVSAAWWQWRPTTPWAVAIAMVTVVAVMHLAEISEFIYYQF